METAAPNKIKLTFKVSKPETAAPAAAVEVENSPAKRKRTPSLPLFNDRKEKGGRSRRK